LIYYIQCYLNLELCSLSSVQNTKNECNISDVGSVSTVRQTWWSKCCSDQTIIWGPGIKYE